MTPTKFFVAALRVLIIAVTLTISMINMFAVLKIFSDFSGMSLNDVVPIGELIGASFIAVYVCTTRWCSADKE